MQVHSTTDNYRDNRAGVLPMQCSINSCPDPQWHSTGGVWQQYIEQWRTERRQDRVKRANNKLHGWHAHLQHYLGRITKLAGKHVMECTDT